MPVWGCSSTETQKLLPDRMAAEITEYRTEVYHTTRTTFSFLLFLLYYLERVGKVAFKYIWLQFAPHLVCWDLVTLVMVLYIRQHLTHACDHGRKIAEYGYSQYINHINCTSHLNAENEQHSNRSDFMKVLFIRIRHQLHGNKCRIVRFWSWRIFAVQPMMLSIQMY